MAEDYLAAKPRLPGAARWLWPVTLHSMGSAGLGCAWAVWVEQAVAPIRKEVVSGTWRRVWFWQ